MTSSTENMNEQISERNQAIEALEAATIEQKKELQDLTGGGWPNKCFNSIWLVVIAIPIIVFVLLYWVEPGFVQRKEGNKYIRDEGRLWLWTFIISAILWVLVWLYAYARGYSGSQLCYS